MNFIRQLKGFGDIFARGFPAKAWQIFMGPKLMTDLDVFQFFILLLFSALDELPKDLSGKDRLKKALGQVGGSITMTTLTDLVAFAISASSDFPAIKVFCFFAMAAILMTYLLIVTVFLAFVALDIRRVESNRWDIFCCVTEKESTGWETSGSTISKKVRKSNSHLSVPVSE